MPLSDVKKIQMKNPALVVREPIPANGLTDNQVQAIDRRLLTMAFRSASH